jgi:hypothetical protein
MRLGSFGSGATCALAFERGTLVLLLRQSRLAHSALEIARGARLPTGVLVHLGGTPMCLLGTLVRCRSTRAMLGGVHSVHCGPLPSGGPGHLPI